jgi:hypothetical protein
VASLTTPRFSVVSGGAACVACALLFMRAFPALARYDSADYTEQPDVVA